MRAIDKYGAIVQTQSDGSTDAGDSANWNGHFQYLTGTGLTRPNFFKVGFGAYVRHPDPKATTKGFGSYYKNPWNGCISRDQLTGILAAKILIEDFRGLLEIGLHWACRGFLFAYNTINNGELPETAKWKLPDLTLLDMWALYLRGFGPFSWIFWPLLCILDLQMLVNTLLVNKSSDNDQISYAIKLCVSREFVPTPVSYLSAKLLDVGRLLLNIKSYWCGWRNIPEMYPLYEKALKELL